MFYVLITIVLIVLLLATLAFGDRFIRIVGSFAIGAVLFFWTLFNAIYQVPAGHIGLVYSFGAIIAQTGEGFQLVAPWRSVHAASARVQSHKFEKLDSASQETQEVFVQATINIQVQAANIQDLYRGVGPDYFEILVRPRVFQAIKDETVKYRSVDILPRREAIRRSVRTRLTDELKEYSIKVEDFLVDNLGFTKEFHEAIENKQIATQNALAEEQRIVVAKNKALQAVETAQGEGEARLIIAIKEAEANASLAKSVTPELVQYLMVNKLAPNVNVMMIPAGQQFILGADALAKR